MNDDHRYDRLIGAEPLSQVIFVHDYLQLIFEPYTLSIFAPLQVSIDGRILGQPDPGYYDAICRLIGHRPVGVVRTKGVQLAFAFSRGTQLLVSLREEDAVGVEIVMVRDATSSYWDVERYDD